MVSSWQLRFESLQFPTPGLQQLSPSHPLTHPTHLPCPQTPRRLQDLQAAPSGQAPGLRYVGLRPVQGHVRVPHLMEASQRLHLRPLQASDVLPHRLPLLAALQPEGRLQQAGGVWLLRGAGAVVPRGVLELRGCEGPGRRAQEAEGWGGGRGGAAGLLPRIGVLEGGG